MRRVLFVGWALFASSTVWADQPGNLPATIPLWPQRAPGSEARAATPKEVTGDNVSNDLNTILSPCVPERGTGTAVILCPGGEYSKLCLGHVYANARHGFGDRCNAKPSAAARWPERFTESLSDTRLLYPVSTSQP